jgi:hypothetical protein
MSVQIQKGSVDIAVIDPDGQIIGRANNGNSQWQRRLPSRGDYAIEVSATSDAIYIFSIEVR